MVPRSVPSLISPVLAPHFPVCFCQPQSRPSLNVTHGFVRTRGLLGPTRTQLSLCYGAVEVTPSGQEADVHTLVPALT